MIGTRAETSTCVCKPYKECNWSRKTVNKIIKLGREIPERRNLLKFIRDRICEGKSRTIYCCGKIQQSPSQAQLKELKGNKEEENTNHDDKVITAY